VHSLRRLGRVGRPLNLDSKDFPIVSTALWDSGSFDCECSRLSVKDRLRDSNRPLMSAWALWPACKPGARASIVSQRLPLKS